jgi:hypothetical protein
MTDYFLNTCIFLAYAYHFDPYNAQCVKFFDENRSRFTGKRVKSELEGTLRRRKRLYVALASHLGRGGSAKEFISRRKNAMNANDRRHFEQVLSVLDGLSPPKALTYVRDIDNAARRGINEAFQKVQHPLIDFAYDPACENKIYTVVQERIDAKILVDALRWSQNRSQIIFLTLDWTDLISLRTEITRAIRKYLKVGGCAGLHLEIRHISEIS